MELKSAKKSKLHYVALFFDMIIMHNTFYIVQQSNTISTYGLVPNYFNCSSQPTPSLITIYRNSKKTLQITSFYIFSSFLRFTFLRHSLHLRYSTKIAVSHLHRSHRSQQQDITKTFKVIFVICAFQISMKMA